MKTRIGVLGGTFDPPHVGHLCLAAQALAQLDLDRVLLVVANDPWQKHDGRRISPAEARFAMLAAAVEGRSALEASRLEIERGGESFTIDTVKQLHAPDREIFLIIGSDLVAQLPTWRSWQALPELVTLAVGRRGGGAPVQLSPVWNATELRLPALEISSSELRAMAGDDLPLDFLVPDAVISVIERLRLYRPRPA